MMKGNKLNKETQNLQFEEKRGNRKKFKEKPDAKWNKGSGDLKARPHPGKLTCEKELKRNFRQ